MNVKPSPRIPTAKPRQAPGDATPDVLGYTDYRRFLADYYRARKEAKRDFSWRAFARDAGFPSHGHLKYILEGARNLTQKTLMKLVPALGFDAGRARYFENLVYFNQARTLGEKAVYHKKVLAAHGGSRFRKLEESQLTALRTWRHAAIREMLALAGFRPDAEWIARHLFPRSEAREVREVVNDLLAAGLIRRTANGYAKTDPDITTDDEVRSLLIRDYHVDLLRLAARALNDTPAPERDLSSVCFAIRGEDWPSLKQRLQAMRKELKDFEAEPGKGDRIVQVSLQAFPLAIARGAA